MLKVKLNKTRTRDPQICKIRCLKKTKVTFLKFCFRNTADNKKHKGKVPA